MKVAIIFIALSIASQYSPGVAQEVIENRLANNTIKSVPRTNGYIAVQDCEDIGKVWYVKNPVSRKWESFLVIDCSMPAGTDGTIEWMVENNIAMEVDHKTAVRWGTVGRGIYVSWTKQNPYEYVEARNEKEKRICEQ